MRAARQFSPDFKGIETLREPYESLQARGNSALISKGLRHAKSIVSQSGGRRQFSPDFKGIETPSMSIDGGRAAAAIQP